MSHINTELFISRRISSRKGGRENIMVRIATLTVAVGMAVMILALAVVTGFKREVTAKRVGCGPQVRIVSLHSNASLETDPVTVDTALMESVARLPRFASVAPYAVKGGMIKTPEAIQGVALKGIGPDYDTAFLQEHLVVGSLPAVGGEVRSKELLVSANIARMLGLAVDDREEMLFISSSRPVRRDRFKVCGIYSTGMEELDNAMTFTDIRNVQRLNGWNGEQVTGYEVMTTDFSRLDEFAEAVYGAVFDYADRTSDVLKVEDIVSLNPNTFDWLRAHNINAAVIIGKDQQPILDAFAASAPDIPLTIIDPANNDVIMERAVDAAGGYAQSGDVVLMAPACASMDQFKSYADRGNQFAQQAQRWVNEYGEA